MLNFLWIIIAITAGAIIGLYLGCLISGISDSRFKLMPEILCVTIGVIIFGICGLKINSLNFLHLWSNASILSKIMLVIFTFSVIMRAFIIPFSLLSASKDEDNLDQGISPISPSSVFLLPLLSLSYGLRFEAFAVFCCALITIVIASFICIINLNLLEKFNPKK